MKATEYGNLQPLMRISTVTFCWLALWGSVCLSAFGQSVTMTDVSRARDQLARAKGLTDPERTEISRLHDQAAQSLQQEIRWRVQQVGHARTRSAIEAELAAARQAAILPQPGPVAPPPSETVQQVEEELVRVRNDRASRLKRRDDLLNLRASLVRRGDEITARRAEIQEGLQSIQDEVSILSLASASPQWEQASRLALQARRQSLEQELQALETEREALALRRQLIPLQRESHLLKLEAAEQLLAELRVRLDKARAQDAKTSLDNAVTQARKLAEGFSDLSAIAAVITTRATELWGPDGIDTKNARIAVQSEQMRASLARFKAITADTRRRFQNAGVFSPASDWWPPRVEKFGKPAEVGVLVIALSAAEAVARRELFKLEEERNAAPAFETEVQQFLAASGKKPGDAGYAEFKTRVRSLLQLQRSVMTDYLASERVYLNGLRDARRVAEELLRVIRELQSFVFQHVLWARSVSGSVLPSPIDSAKAFLWFFSFPSWAGIMAGFVEAKAMVLLWIALLLLVIALFRLQPRLRKMYFESRSDAWKAGRLRPLFYILFLALLSTTPVPLAIASVGWVIGQAGEQVDLGRAIAAGAQHAAWFLYLALLTRMMLARGGAAERLLAWPQEACQRLDDAIRKLTFVFPPLWFVSSALAEEGMYFNGDALLQAHHNSLGRSCFLLAVISLLYVARGTLRPRGAVADALGSGYDTHGFARARVARVGLSLALVVAFLLALTGFYITGYLMVKNLLTTGAWTILLVLVFAVLQQWRLSRNQGVSPSRSPADDVLVRRADLQVQRLSRFGLTLVWIIGALFIWSAALPGLSMLRKVELLPEFRVVMDKTPAPDVPPAAAETPKTEQPAAPSSQPSMLPVPAPPDKPAAEPPQPRQPLYLSDLLLAIFLSLLTAMLVSNIPGLLHFTVFRRFALDQGGQYAANTITRYVVIFLGLFTVSGILGLNWSKVQWLAAALTFGIGFGLQEIFANFAAGLIILLDRSIRVGDVVTVGTLSGIVARIQMRATTITLWDLSDMVVPNKEFVTTKLVNWTLSNPETRVDLKVGVDYRSDVEQVREVLMRVAQEHPAVLKDPAPQVLLTEFASSAILFELRVFGMYSYGRPVLLDELHRAVIAEFRKLGIEIAFPQLDLHLKTQLPAAREPPT